MTTRSHDIERLLSAARGYDALFMAAGALEEACEENPEALTIKEIRLLLETLADHRFESHRTSLFFYGRFARILTHTSKRRGPRHPLTIMTLEGLTTLASEATGNRHLAICAASETFVPRGTIHAPQESLDAPTPCSCHDLLMEVGFPRETPWTHTGRSLCYKHKGEILVIKCARPGEDPRGLASEWHWMQILKSETLQAGEIPTPICAPLLHIQGLPEEAASNTGIAFLTTPAYFNYPNEPLAPMETHRAVDVIGQAAFLFGHLASQGILHTAPVPLFHNRIQVDRRDDQGLYLWQKGGRLDSWLASCRYPNFGLSGLRDFEHITPGQEMKKGEFYRTLGNQILGLLLVAGSHFRSLQFPSDLPPQTGGKDHRHLFDIEALEAMITAILNGYYQGYTDRSDPFPFQAKRAPLARRMIEEMGIDHHMEELLRARDQGEMDEKSFQLFLMERGYSHEKALSTPRGIADILLFTGPHLGPFNGKISCPELIEFTATLASITMVDGFLNHR